MKTLTCLMTPILIAWALPALPSLAQSVYEPYTFTTLAGYSGYGSADGTGSTAPFISLSGVAVDTAGNVYVADGGNSTIRKVTPAGVVTTLAGLAGTGGTADGTGSAARFVGPQGMAVDGEGNLYVADDGNSTIRKATPAGVVTTLAGLAGTGGSADGTGNAARFDSPHGVAVDTAGNVYVADTGNATIRKVTPAGVVTTLAGLAAVDGHEDGRGSTARFHYPRGVAVDTAGNVYVADTFNHTIRKITAAGVVTTLAGLAGTGGSADGTGNAARFDGPYGVAVDTAGNVYVADTGNYTIRKVTPAGVVTTLAGLAGTGVRADGTGSAARFNSPHGVAVDSAGNVYVTEGITIRKVTPPGAVTTLAGMADGAAGNADGTGIAARFNQPWGTAVDTAGNVYVADTDNNTIRKVTPAGVVTTLAGVAQFGADGSPVGGYADGTGIGARFFGPSGVAVDGAGNVYVADSLNHTIRKVTPAGVVTTLAGSAGSYGNVDGTGSAARFDYPNGVAVDGVGNVYVADTFNHTIRKVTAAGVVTTLAGRGFQFDDGGPGNADGIGSDARFHKPQGVAVDNAGNVYVAEMGNCAIRKVTPAGVVTTLAGLADTPGSADGTGIRARFGGESVILEGPSGVAVDSAGNVYVVDGYNHTIRKVTPAGVVTTLAGQVGSRGSEDGTGSAARFIHPKGVAVDSAGFLYVADTQNNTIRKGNPALIVLKAGFDGPIFALDLAGQMGRCVTLEMSTDLVNWEFLGVAGFSNKTQLTMTDPDASHFPVRFYRASYQPVLLGE